MSELTRERISEIKEYFGDSDISDLCHLALRTYDAEKLAEQAQTEAGEAWTQATRTVDELDQARQGAAKLREALQDIARGPLQGPGDFTRYAQSVAESALAKDALHSSDAPDSGATHSAAWIRYELPLADHESAIKDRLIELGWTPPSTDAPASEPTKKERGDYSVAEVEAMEPMYPAPADRPEQQGENAREDAWLIDRGCIPQWSSPYYKGRPEPSEALEETDFKEQLREVDDAFDAALGEPCHCGKMDGELNCPRCDAMSVAREKLHALEQPAPAVPDAVRQMPGKWRQWADNKDKKDPVGSATYAAQLRNLASQLERALAAQPSESPAVPDGYALIRQDVVDFLHGIAPLDGEDFSDRQDRERGRYWWRKLLPPFSDAAPTPDEGKK